MDREELETIFLTGHCPKCLGNESVTWIEYEEDNLILVDCSSCGFKKDYKYSDAYEYGLSALKYAVLASDVNLPDDD